MALLMWGPIRQQSATVDEPMILAAGYTYVEGMGFWFQPDQTPLAKMWLALPLLFMRVEIPPSGVVLLERREGYRYAQPWYGSAQPAEKLFPQGRDNWYFWPYIEAEGFGQVLVYGGRNDAERMLVAGRAMQTVLTLLTGLIIALWAGKQAGQAAAIMAAALWVFNPVALAHGHVIQTDAGAALMFVVTLWAFIRFLERPQRGNAVWLGLALGATVLVKSTALLLLPIFVALAALSWWRQRWDSRQTATVLKRVPLVLVTVWALMLLVYEPFWSPAPWLSAQRASQLGVPWWFQTFRPVLIPPDFFKSVALQIAETRMGRRGYLCGAWSTHGWWYYYPVAFALKVPIPLLLLSAAGVVLFLKRVRNASLGEAAVWIASAVYLGFAMTNKMDIGIRHVLPMFPLLAVGTAVAISRLSRWPRVAAWVLCGWLALVAVRAHPFYLEYFNELAGGTPNGHRYLLDSNLDWGQDVKRLRNYLDSHGLQHIYLRYFGAPAAVQYYKINCTFVSAEQAHSIRNGTLVVSAMELMKPEWEWLRQQYQPADRVGYSLFVYRLGDQP